MTLQGSPSLTTEQPLPPTPCSAPSTPESSAGFTRSTPGKKLNCIRVFVYAVNYLNECHGFRIVLSAFYNWILLAKTRYPVICLRIAARDRKRCICGSFDVNWDITIVKNPDYSFSPAWHQCWTRVITQHTRNIPLKPSAAKPFHFLSTLTFIRTISRHFYTISQHHHSPQSTDQTKHSSYKFSPHIYLPKVQAFERKKVGLSARVAKIMFIWSSIVGACLYTLSGKKSFRMSRWLASHTIPLWRLHELLAWYKDH